LGLGVIGALPAQGREFESLNDVYYWATLCRLQRDAREYDKALAACEQAIALEPDAADLWALRSSVLLEVQNYPDAIVSADQALFFDPRYSLASAYLCMGYAGLNNAEAALDACNDALRIDGNWGDSSPAMAWLYRGIILSQAGQPEQAAIALERALLEEPDDSLALAYQCRVRVDLGLAQTAFPSCEAARLGNGRWGNESPAIAWAEQGRAHAQMRDFSAAIAAYDQALAINPSDPSIWTAQGQILQQLQRPEEALTSFTRATELAATYSLAHLGRCATLNRLGQHEPALEACNLAIQGDGRWGDLSLATALNQRSIALTGLNQYEDALASINRAVGMAPNDAEAHNHQGVILWYLERYDEALAANQTALDLAPETVRAWLNRGIILRSMGRYNEALAAYDQGLELAPYDGDIWANRSVVLWNLQRYPEALESANQAIGRNPESAQAWFNRAIALTSLAQWPEALDAYTQVIALTPQDASAHTGQGLALFRLQRYPEAIAAFQVALALNPAQPLAQQGLQASQQAIQPQSPPRAATQPPN
jgi:tetratricopeptide (TPR) repeat protein